MYLMGNVFAPKKALVPIISVCIMDYSKAVSTRNQNYKAHFSDQFVTRKTPF